MSNIHSATRAQHTQVQSDRGVGLALTPAERTKAASVAAGSGGAQVTGHARNYAGTSYVAKPSIGKFFTDLSGYNKEATQFKEQRLAKHRDRLVEALLQPSPDVEKVKACIKKMSILQNGASLRLSSEIPADAAGRNALLAQQARLLNAIASVKTQLGKDTRFDQALGVIEKGFKNSMERLGRAIAFDAQVQAFAAKPLDVSKAATDNWRFSPDGGTGAILARNNGGKIDTVLKVDPDAITRQKTMQIAEVINKVNACASRELPFDFPQHKLVTLAGTSQTGAMSIAKWDKAKKDEVRQVFETEFKEREKVAAKWKKKDDNSPEFSEASTAKAQALSDSGKVKAALLADDYAKVRSLVDAYIVKLNKETPPPAKSLDALTKVLGHIDTWIQPQDVQAWNTTSSEIENIYKGLLDERTQTVDGWKGNSASPQLTRAIGAKDRAEIQLQRISDELKNGATPTAIRGQLEDDMDSLKADLQHLSTTKGVHSQTWQRAERAYFALNKACSLIGEWETAHAKPPKPDVDSTRKAATDSVLEKYQAASDLHAKVLAKWERSGNSGKIAEARMATFESKADHARLLRAVNEGATPQDINTLVQADIDRSNKARQAVAAKVLRDAEDLVKQWLAQPVATPAPVQTLPTPQQARPTLGDLQPGLDGVAKTWTDKAVAENAVLTQKVADWKLKEKARDDEWLQMQVVLTSKPGSPEYIAASAAGDAQTKWANAKTAAPNDQDKFRRAFEDARKKAVAFAPDKLKTQWSKAENAFNDAESAMKNAKQEAENAETRRDRALALPGQLTTHPLLMQSGVPGQVAANVSSHEKIAAMRSRQFGLDLGANVVLLPLLGLGDHLAPSHAGTPNFTNLMIHKPDGSADPKLGVIDLSPHNRALEAKSFKDLVKDLKELAALAKKNPHDLRATMRGKDSLQVMHDALFEVGGGFIDSNTNSAFKDKQDANDTKNLLANNMLAGIVNGIEYFERHQQLFADAHSAAGGPVEPELLAEVAQAFAGLSQKERQALKSLATSDAAGTQPATSAGTNAKSSGSPPPGRSALSSAPRLNPQAHA